MNSNVWRDICRECVAAGASAIYMSVWLVYNPETYSIASISKDLAFLAKSRGDNSPDFMALFKDHWANEILSWSLLFEDAERISSGVKPIKADAIVSLEKSLLFIRNGLIVLINISI